MCAKLAYLVKIDGFIKIYVGIRYLALLASEKFNAIYDRIIYLISTKVVLHIALIINLHDVICYNTH